MPLVSESKTLALLEQRVLPEIAKSAKETIRAWVPCCASGEDAYALAMLLSSYVEEHRLSLDVRVIASDQDADALGKARSGVYPHSVRCEFSAAGLDRYLREHDEGFRVMQRIRDCILLSHHDLLNDPPYPRLHLIVCGIFLGELGADEQAEVLCALHGSLVSGGFLLLGPRRLPDDLDELYASVDRERGLYRRREASGSSRSLALGNRWASSSLRFARQPKRDSDRPGLGGALERLVLDAYSPACLVVNDEHQIVYSLGKLSRFFNPPRGLPSNDLLQLAKPKLREALRGLLQSPLRDGDAARVRAAELDDRGAPLDVTIEVRTLATVNGALQRALVFKEQPAERGAASPPHSWSGAPPLAELSAARSVTESEELASHNQELMRLNEELESANQELQISKEELQSINEEMKAVNEELRASVLELDQANSDLRNLMDNTQIATLFLDKELHIRVFTPAAQNLFRFIPADRGRPLTDIAPRFRFDDLRSELLHVLRTRAVREAQVQASGRWYLMRILPYLSEEAQVEGLVLTFSDITELKLADLEVKRLSSALEQPLHDSRGSPYAKISGLLDVTEIKRERERALAREQQQAIVADLGLRALDAEDLDVFLQQSLQVVCIGVGAELCELTRLSADGQSLKLIASWPPGVIEGGLDPVEVDRSAAVALETAKPSVLTVREPFPQAWPERLRRAGVRAGARFAIRAGDPFGVLGVYRRVASDFSKEDLIFLHAISNVFTSAIQRQLIEGVRLKESQEAALRESERQLRRGERLASLGTFATGIAHELNNPLSNIVLSADYAAKTSDAKRSVKLLEAVRENALRCGRIVESVLRFARDEATEKWSNALNPIARHAAAHVISYVGPAKLNITFELVEPSPRLDCNPTEIEQVFVNLLKNAAQAHAGRCHVRVRSELAGNEVRIAVSDDGPGIPVADLEKVFDPFYSTQRAAGGTGLGLSITHRIVATHGGSIRVTNTKGGGASFEIRLPLAQQNGATPGQHNEGS